MSSLMTRKLGNLQILEIVYLIIERNLEYKISKSKKDICERYMCRTHRLQSCEAFFKTCIEFQVDKTVWKEGVETKIHLKSPLSFS